MEKARLVAIGDSLTQGFMSGAVCRTDISFAAMIARSMGSGDTFRYPPFKETDGLPINLETLLRLLSEKCGSRIGWWNIVAAVKLVHDYMDRVEDYWEGRMGSLALPCREPFHNLSVWGFEAGDADMVSEMVCRKQMEKHPKQDNLYRQIPELAMYITARRVLNPGLEDKNSGWTQVDNARWISSREGIENLIFWMGCNNCLGTVLDLEIRLSSPQDINRYPHQRTSNLYLPEHFKAQYSRVAEKIADLNARRVFTATIPHVTIPPVTRGVSPKGGRAAGGYYEYYTRPWIWDDDFNPDSHPHLTAGQARNIDWFIDQYNVSIINIAQKYGWYVVDICGMLDSLAFRRNRGSIGYGFPDGLAKALMNNPATSSLVNQNGEIRLDTRFIRLGGKGGKQIVRGGLFSLDGVHPTTIGYGLVAHEFINKMREAGVSFCSGMDWDWVVAEDSLVTNPPVILENLKNILEFLGRKDVGHLIKQLLTVLRNVIA